MFVLKEIPQQLLVIFLIAVTGYLLGRISIRGISLGTAAVFLTALVAGHLGFTAPPILQTLGLVFFITSIGFSAGPGFLQRLRKNGLSYVVLCICVALTGSVVCAIIIRVFRVEAPLAVGMMTGAFTTSPGFAAAKEAVSATPAAVSAVAAGYGIIYPVGVVCKVLFVQILPRILRADMEEERRKIALPVESSEAAKKAVSVDPWGLCIFSVAAVLGILLGAIHIPLPGQASFSLGMTGGPLLMALLLSGKGHLGKLSLRAPEKLCGPIKELGLVLFFIGSGTEGGAVLSDILARYGFMLLLYGFVLVAIPLVVGYIIFRWVLKLPLLNGLGSMTASMTCTPSLAVLIKTAGTDDVAAAYATTYPIALIILVLVVQLLVTL